MEIPGIRPVFSRLMETLVSSLRSHMKDSATLNEVVSNVTSRRACQRFMLKFNPDTHWSSTPFPVPGWSTHLECQQK